MPKEFIDPTLQELAGNTTYENLNIYVDLKAQRRGYTTINKDTDDIRTVASGKFNLLGFKKDNGNNRVFTTEYTEVYRNETNSKGFYEGFGITNISIEVNASYVPVVKIDFIDVKGMSFFNKKEDSPYSVLFDFPPPIFSLTVKGYYGYALDYKLHMLRHNTSFDADTGNYFITAEFVGNTFAPLADMLYHYVLTSSKLTRNENSPDARDNVDNLHELVVRSKNIKEVIATKLSDRVNDVNEISDDLNIINNILRTNNDLDNNIKHIELKFNDVRESNLRINSFRIADFDEQSLYYIAIPIKTSNSTSERNILINYYQRIFVNNRNQIYFRSDNTPIIETGDLRNFTDDILRNIPAPILYIDITNLYKNINETYQNKINRLNIKKEDIEKETKSIITKELGFEPTIKNVMEIICNDIDKWMNILGNTYNESVDYIEANKNKFINDINSNGNIDIFPFPDYIEQNKKDIPRGRLSNIPEVRLVDDFIDAFIQSKKERTEEPINTDTVTDINGTNIWFPTNPLDSTFNNKQNVSPYNNVTNHIDVIKKIFARYYIYNYYTLTSSDLNNQIFNTTIKNFFEGEFVNVVNTINQVKILQALKNVNSDLRTGNFIQNLNRLLGNEFIRNSDINLILNNIDVDINTEFSGINFNTDQTNVLASEIEQEIRRGNLIDRSGRSILENSIKNEYYLFDRPLNNTFDQNDEIKQILKENISNNIYKLNILSPSSFGLTLNEKNNIIFYDSNSVDKTSFRTYTNTNTFNNIILDSINIKSINNINNIIYDTYNDDNDLLKSIFGYLNIIYIPNLKHIITILMNKAIIVELPVIVKLYIGAYLYGIDTNLVDLGSDDFITNTYRTLFNPQNRNERNLLNEHVNVRNIFIGLLNNLTNTDKELFINYYKNTILEDINIVDSGETNFTFLFKNLIDNLRTNDEFNNANYDISILHNEEIISILKRKTIITVKSNYTFSNKNNFDINDNFINQNTITSNLGNNLQNNFFVNELRTFFTKLENQLDDRIDDIESKKGNEELSENRNRSSFELIRVETYYSFKTFVDRWFNPQTNNKVNSDKGFLLIENDNDHRTNRFFDLFTFVNRWYDKTEAENIIIDTTILSDFENDMNINMLTVIGRLLNHNGFEFYPLQNFIDYTSNNSENIWSENVIFRPFLDRNRVFSRPRFTCMYIGGKSKYLNSENNKYNVFKDDGFTSESLPDDAVTENREWFGFLVKFGDGKQSVFSSIQINTEEHQPTNESLATMSQIMDYGENTPVPVYQNLYTVYEQRSYTCKVKMFGNVMIQPTQLFDLRNVPMFNGVYIILKVNHSIEGETNSMITEFEGVRLPKEPRNFVTKPYEIYGKNLLPDIDDYIQLPKSTRERSDKQLKKEKRKIYLVAGHSNLPNETGATYFDLIEKDLNIELRDIIKQILDNNSIPNETDNDDMSLQNVVNDLNSKVNENDIVVDIHFNSSSNTNNNPPGQGTEVFIKDGKDDFIITLAKKTVDTISDILGIKKRKGIYNELPTGVKIKNESHIETSTKGNLAMFNINAKVILIEVCFINNRKEMDIYENKKYKLAEGIASILSKTTVTG